MKLSDLADHKGFFYVWRVIDMSEIDIIIHTSYLLF